MAAMMFGGLASWLASAGLGCAASLSCTACRAAGAGATAASARLAYTLLFLCSQVLAWLLRDFAKPLLQKLPWVMRTAVGEPPDAWFGQQGVLRVSLGSALFFGGLAVALLGVSSGADPRVRHLHRGSWALKTLAWLVLTVLPFFLPNGLIDAYAWLARFASGIFLVVQMVILLDFAYVWNESWAGREQRAWLAALLAACAACYGGGLALLGLSYRWFAPSGTDCGLNVFVTTLALLLGLAYTAAALHPDVTHGSLLCSGVIFVYNAYLTLSALSSEPAGGACDARPGALGGRAAGEAGAVTGMVLALAAVAYSAARAGSSGTFLFSEGSSDSGSDGGAEGIAAPLLDAEAEEVEAGSDDDTRRAAQLPAVASAAPRPLRYNLAAFHAVFALASCYVGMLLTDWGSGAAAGRDTLGVGWASCWVKILSSWATAALYAWSLAAPLVFPERF